LRDLIAKSVIDGMSAVITGRVREMNAPAISESDVHRLTETLFAEDLHAKRVLSLGNATLGVIRSGALGVHAIGRGLALARSTSQKHSVKQVDRFLGNESIRPWDLFASWVPFVVAERTEVVIALDWTDFESDDQCTLVASLLTSHGRPTPLVWLSVVKSELKGLRNEWEDAVLQRLKETIPVGVKVTVLADRGFGDSKLYALMAEMGFGYVVRFRELIAVTAESGEVRTAAEWIPERGQRRMLRNASVTEHRMPVPAVVCVKAKGMKEGWCLATSLKEATADEVVKLYGRRFTIEESFRDIKDLRFGMGLSAMRISTPERRDRILLVSAVAIALLTLLGAAGEAAGLERHFKANTSKKRTYSLFRQGCMYYEFLPGMRAEWAEPLITNFVDLIRQHAVLSSLFGPI
jgi:hypothetical protein